MTLYLRKRHGPVDKDGCHLLGGARFFCCVTLLSSISISPAAASPLDDALALGRAGAPSLALDLIDETQPSAGEDQQAWISYEQARLDILETRGDWSAIAARLAALPTVLPQDFRISAATRRAKALLASESPAEARHLLATLVWSDAPSPVQLSEWRALITQTYLAEGRAGDAYLAMLRYRQDYGDSGLKDAVLGAQVLLGNGRPGEAATQLEPYRKEPDAAALLLLAELRQGRSAREVVQAARQRIQSVEDRHTEQLLWATVAEAAFVLGDFASQAIALEHVLQAQRQVPLPHGVFQLGSDALWEAYLGYAKGASNREQLLIGDDEAWFSAAEAAGRMYPIRMRSLLAFLAHEAQRPEDRERAHRALAAELMGQDGRLELVRTLYLGTARFGGPDALPIAARHLLVDQALAEADLELASELLKGLEAAPEGVDPFLWQLRRAKVFILAANFQSAGELLKFLVAGSGSQPGGQVDRLVQLLFDLQTVGEHDLACSLFEALLEGHTDTQFRRELLYWMGDSRSAQKRYRDAARLYLQSAIHNGAGAMDPWAQTARYQAAKALRDAGESEDAARLFRQLLAATDDRGRQAVLRRDLEQLQLRR